MNGWINISIPGNGPATISLDDSDPVLLDSPEGRAIYRMKYDLPTLKLMDENEALKVRLAKAEDILVYIAEGAPHNWLMSAKHHGPILYNFLKGLDTKIMEWAKSEDCKHNFQPVSRTYDQCTICGERQ